MALPADPALPLADLKVLDFSWAGVGPNTVKYLADHGATVVRVESHARYDVVRLGPPWHEGKPGIERSQFYASYNTSKLGIALDLSRPPAADGRGPAPRRVAARGRAPLPRARAPRLRAHGPGRDARGEPQRPRRAARRLPVRRRRPVDRAQRARRRGVARAVRRARAARLARGGALRDARRARRRRRGAGRAGGRGDALPRCERAGGPAAGGRNRGRPRRERARPARRPRARRLGLLPVAGASGAPGGTLRGPRAQAGGDAGEAPLGGTGARRAHRARAAGGARPDGGRDRSADRRTGGLVTRSGADAALSGARVPRRQRGDARTARRRRRSS